MTWLHAAALYSVRHCYKTHCTRVWDRNVRLCLVPAFWGRSMKTELHPVSLLLQFLPLSPAKPDSVWLETTLWDYLNPAATLQCGIKTDNPHR